MKKTIFLSVLIVLAAVVYAAVVLTVCDWGEEKSEKWYLELPDDAEAVDLGLPSGTLWANMNVGAQSPADSGAYFMWGYVEESYNDYAKGRDVYCRPDICMTHEVEFSDIQGDVRYDAATANWGEDWVLPTKEQIEELVSECDWELTTEEDSEGKAKRGYLVKSRTNRKHIFLPMAGRLSGSSFYNCDEHGEYWASTPSDRELPYYTDNETPAGYWMNAAAGGLAFNENNWFKCVDGLYRCMGRSVRAVKRAE